MPLAMSKFGVTLGVILIVWCGLTSAFGLYLQSRCTRYLDRGSSSFFALSQITYPNAAVVFDAAIAIKCFGVGVSYMIIIGDLMPAVAAAFGAGNTGWDFLADRRFWITVFFVIFLIPLSFPKKLDSLKYTSLVALFAIGYLIILVVYHFAVDDKSGRGPIRLVTWEGPVAALSSLPVMIFAYTCHQNVSRCTWLRKAPANVFQMFSIVNEIKDNSPGSLVGVIGSSIGSAASVYVLVAITGYLTFGDAIQGNIVGMCKYSLSNPSDHDPPSPSLTSSRPTITGLHHCQSRHCLPRHLLRSPPSPPLPRLHRRRPPLAPRPFVSYAKRLLPAWIRQSAPIACWRRPERYPRQPWCPRSGHVGTSLRLDHLRYPDSQLLHSHQRVQSGQSPRLRGLNRVNSHQLYPAGIILLQNKRSGKQSPSAPD